MTRGSILRLACLYWLAMLTCGLPAAAQTLPAPPPVEASGLLTRSDFSLMLALLGTDDPRFTADGSLTADVDLFGYGTGRANLFIDYEGTLGNERHDFDLNQGNYVLEASASRRFGPVEVAGVFRHASRHLSDRAHLGSISWNVFGVRALHQWKAGRSTIDARLDVGKVYEPHFVDYQWTNDIRIGLRRPISPRVALFAGGHGELIRVDPAKVRDHGPCGARVEAGVRLQGTAAALELFVGYERRIDAFPTDRSRVRLLAFGFRIYG